MDCVSLLPEATSYGKVMNLFSVHIFNKIVIKWVGRETTKALKVYIKK